MERLDERAIREIVKRAQAGDLSAYAALYDEFFSRVYAFVMLRTRSRADAEDITQNVFIRLLEALPSYRPGRAPFSAWLFTIANNAFLNFCTSQKYRRHSPIDDVSEGELPRQIQEDSADRLDSVKRLREHLDRLTEDQQRVVFMKYVGGLTNEEIAMALDKPVGAVKSLQHRALNRIERALTRMRGTEAAETP